jgi:hypothetical protein
VQLLPVELLPLAPDVAPVEPVYPPEALPELLPLAPDSGIAPELLPLAPDSVIVPELLPLAPDSGIVPPELLPPEADPEAPALLPVPAGVVSPEELHPARIIAAPYNPQTTRMKHSKSNPVRCNPRPAPEIA